MIREGTLGIHPAGALGVAFFVHARGDCLIGRTGDGITHLLKATERLALLENGTTRSISLKGRIFGNLLEADALGCMPELLFVCCNPDQLGLLTGELVRFLESLAERGHLTSIDGLRQRVPILLVLPNGILSEQTIRTYEEQIDESLLMGRLPGVTGDMSAALIDRVVRGISLQAGGRRGGGAETVYVIEKKGSLLFAGGGELERERVETIIAAHDYTSNHVRGVPGTRIEFDKAMITIVLNVGGLIHMVNPDGALSDLRMGDLCKDPSKTDFVQRVTRAVFDVGKAIDAYPQDAEYDEVWEAHRATIMRFAGHVTSSVKQFRDAIGRELKSVKLFANEEWILTPLSRYAANAGLKDEEALFRSLRRQVQASMARAIRYREEDGHEGSMGAATMKLTAQRNIGIELFEADNDNIVLIGTMLDSEHLIKLELNIYLPDEQITRSKLDMIRVPFPVCREVETVAERLVGLRIERGVLGEIVRRVGGKVGCSHIKEIATNIVYFAASQLLRRRAGVDPVSVDSVPKTPDERFALTKELLRDSCLAYCQSTSQALDHRIGIRRVGDEHIHPTPLGDYEASLGVLLRDRGERLGEKTYLRYRENELVRDMSFKSFADRVWSVARHLIALDVRPGDRIAMLSENRPEMFIFELAVMSIGAVTVPIFAGYPPPRVAYTLDHSRPRFVVASGMHQLEKIEASRYPWIRKYFAMDHDDACAAWGASPLADLMTDGGASVDDLTERIDAVAPDDMCMVMYTSGTTGPPKGVRLCHRNLISQQKAISHVWDVGESDVFMSYLPWHHSFGGLFERCITLYHGAQLCLDDSRGRDIDRMLENWKHYEPSIFLSVPRVHDQLITRAREDTSLRSLLFSGRLRLVFTAGAPLPAHVAEAYRQQSIPVLEGWGLTETSPCVTVTTKDTAWRSGFVGFPIPGVRVRVDSDQEILVKGPNVMQGYLDDEEATAHVIDDEGWFHTGDLGEFTADGLRIFGRKDGAFKLTTGEKVHPQRIENVLVNESPYISMALVLGSGKDFVAALIYPDMSRLRDWARDKEPSGDDLLDAPAVRDLYAAELVRINPMIEVKYHRVKRALLIGREPSLASGELTSSGKLVRKAVLANQGRLAEALFSPESSANLIEPATAELQRT